MDVHLKDRSGTVDFVARAAEFTVSPADLLDRGYRFDSLGGCAEGTVVVPWNWEVRPWTMTKRVKEAGNFQQDELFRDKRGQRGRRESAMSKPASRPRSLFADPPAGHDQAVA